MTSTLALSAAEARAQAARALADAGIVSVGGPARVAELMRAAVALPGIETVDPASLYRALGIYEVERLDFAEAYLVALAETTGVREIVSFDRSIDRIESVTRREP